MLSAISKRIITARLLDKGITVNASYLENILIDSNSFTDNNTMYDYIVNNYGKIIIE